MRDDIYTLPENLPVPEDDGACDHLVGLDLPDLRLESSQGIVDVRDFDVLYVYPRAGRPDREMPAGWNEIPGARGCTPQSIAFQDAYARFRELDAEVAGLSAQTVEEQREFAGRNGIEYPVIADPERRLGRALRLPTFEFGAMTLYKRITLVVEACAVAKAFYPVFPPDRNAEEVLAWLDS